MKTKLYTIAEAANRLGVHQTTLRRWADIGHVPVVRLPSGYRRFTEQMLEQIEAQAGLDTPSRGPFASEAEWAARHDRAALVREQLKGEEK